jgi:hypothetical protein
MPNLVETNPIGYRSRLTDLEVALAADETAFGQNTYSFADIALTALPTPSNLVVTPGGTVGSTNYSYIVADTGNGGTFAPTAAVQTTTGNATLTGLAYNTITWAGFAGHVYNIYRSASSGTPSGTGFIGTVTAAANGIQSFVDTGIAATGNTPTVNTTGSLQPAGPIYAGATILSTMGGATPQTSAATGAYSLTVAQIANGIFTNTGSTGGAAVTLPTGAQIVAAFPGVKVGNYFDLAFRNTSGQTCTLTTAASGTTLATGNTNTIITVNTRIFRFTFNNVTPGSESVIVYSIGASAH